MAFSKRPSDKAFLSKKYFSGGVAQFRSFETEGLFGDIDVSISLHQAAGGGTNSPGPWLCALQGASSGFRSAVGRLEVGGALGSSVWFTPKKYFL